MAEFSFNQRLFYAAAAVGLVSTVPPHPLSAQGVSDIFRGLNAVINPDDAQRLENWRDYRTGLETHDWGPDTYSRRDYGDRRFDPNDPHIFRSGAAIILNSGGSVVTNSADIGT